MPDLHAPLVSSHPSAWHPLRDLAGALLLLLLLAAGPALWTPEARTREDHERSAAPVPEEHTLATSLVSAG